MPEDSLTDAQKKVILDYWKEKTDSGTPPSLMEITKTVFGEEVDGRSMQGRLVKDYLGSLSISPKTTQYEKRVVELSEEYKAYIRNNRDKMNSSEMAKILFSNPKLSNLSVECRAVDEFNLSLGKYLVPQEEIPSDDWKSPNTVERTMARVNRYFERGGGIDKDKVTPTQKKNMESLMRYLNVYRFKTQINVYESVNDRELFESTFIRYTYDKPDLQEEEIDQYIILAKEAVLEKRIQGRSERLQLLMDTQTGGEEGQKVSMALAEMIGKITAEYNACINRQKELVNVLKQKRSDRLSKQMQENASILNVIEIWRQEKSRKEWLHIAEQKKAKLEEEIERLSSMEDVMARIMGISKEEAMNGA
jgi:hypothetical protein